MISKQKKPAEVHKLPDDLKKAVYSNPKAKAAWDSITPLARNEWICWTISVKRQVTRNEHVKRAQAELIQGKRRPCCWVGCIHRKDRAISPSARWVLSRSK